MTDRIESLIVEFIRDRIPATDASDLDRDENLFTSGWIDSVGIVRLIAHLQTELGVTVPPAELTPDHFRTIRVMTEYMQELTRR